VSSQYPPGGGVPNWQPRQASQQGQSPLRQTERPPRGSFDPFDPRPAGQEPPGQEPRHQDKRKKRRRLPALVRWPIAVVLTLLALISIAGGIKVTSNTNATSASNAAQANSAAATTTADNRWATTPVTTIFPATITAAYSGILWERVAVDSSTSCSAALTSSWQPSSSQPCTALLRATYVERARTIAATVGIIVNPSSTDAPGANVFTTWITPLSDAQAQSEGLGAAKAATVNYAIHALSAPGTAAASFGDSDLLAMAAGTSLKGAPSDWLGLVVETGSLNGQRTVGALPSPWASQAGGDHRDRDSWYVPAARLAVAFDTYYQKLFGG
jgi:hypothetical protein